jgi:hypothetical protein
MQTPIAVGYGERVVVGIFGNGVKTGIFVINILLLGYGIIIRVVELNP